MIYPKPRQRLLHQDNSVASLSLLKRKLQTPKRRYIVQSAAIEA
ncbi:MAG: hypothetical protein SFY66_01825 [Oculatellaceae cyanobacterium bins.114]|nr:hypothetical protein [Oculatellaceae cyanobacterium bins.114]